MSLKTQLQRSTVLAAFMLLGATAAFAQNVLVNPGFELGPIGFGVSPGWTSFGNVYTEPAAPPVIVPFEGNQVVKMFGNFTGNFEVSGIFQSAPATPGQTWSLSSKSRHFSGDPMVGVSIPRGGNGNWVVQKLIFRGPDGVNDIASVESTILDGSFPTDTWIDNMPVSLVAPAGTASVWAFILYLQPAFDGGAAQIDAVNLENLTATPTTTTTWGRVKSLYR